MTSTICAEPTEPFDEQKLQLTVSRRLVALLADRMYSMPAFVAVIRELHQNAVDACRRKGVVPEISITIRMLPQCQAEITCRDNGTGMTARQIFEDFLSLGGSSKAGDLTATGKFGLAKAIIMNQADWSAHTLDNFLDAGMLDRGEKLQKMDRLNGTAIQVKIEKHVYSSNFKQAIHFLALSGVQIQLKVINAAGDVQETVYEGPVGGVDTSDWRELGSDPSKPGWVLVGSNWAKTPEMQLSIPYHYEGDTYPYREYYTIEPRLKGCAFVRTNGLVQFEMSLGRDIKRNSLLVIELKDMPDVTDPLYPMPTNRESLNNAFREPIEAILRDHLKNPITSSRMVSEPPQRMSILAGAKLSGVQAAVHIQKKPAAGKAGRRGRQESTGTYRLAGGLEAAPPSDTEGNETGAEESFNQDGESVEREGSSVSSFEAVYESTFRHDVVPVDEEDHANLITLEVLLKEWPRKRISRKHWGMMLAWAELLCMVLPKNERFGVGLTGSQAGAERVEYNGSTYYVLNPISLEDISTPVGAILRMWTLANHEGAHLCVSSHGEDFDLEMDQRGVLSADRIGKEIDRLVKVLKGKERPSWEKTLEPIQRRDTTRNSMHKLIEVG